MIGTLRTATSVRACVVRSGIRAQRSHPRHLWKTYSGLALSCTTGTGLHVFGLIESIPRLKVLCIAEPTSGNELRGAVGSAFEFRGDAEVSHGFKRFLQQLATILRLLVRTLSLLAIWTPVAVSSPAMGLAELPFIPTALSVRLRKYWLKALLKVIELSGPTFIKVGM